jgi:hypothetical protein
MVLHFVLLLVALISILALGTFLGHREMFQEPSIQVIKDGKAVVPGDTVQGLENGQFRLDVGGPDELAFESGTWNGQLVVKESALSMLSNAQINGQIIIEDDGERAVVKPKATTTLAPVAPVSSTPPPVLAVTTPTPTPTTSTTPPPQSGAPRATSLPPTTTPIPGAPQQDTKVFLDNGQLRVGFDLEKGATMFFLLPSTAGSVHQTANLINDFDCGRMVQQSYYGNKDGTKWPFPNGEKDWRWNAVQAGDYLNQGSVVRSYSSVENPKCFTSVTTPRHWITGELLDTVTMMQQVCLQGDIVKLSFNMSYSGTSSNAPTNQELPAIFLWRGLSRLATYTGEDPWKNRDLLSLVPPVRDELQPDHVEASENWAAFVKEEDGWGVGVYAPHATTMAYYVAGDLQKLSQAGSAFCSYLSPLKRFAIAPGFSTTYEVYITVGRIQDIRNRFIDLRTQLRSVS